MGTARTALGVAALAFAILALAEGGLRVAGRVGSGEWPATAAVRRHQAFRDYNALYREHPWLHTAAREGAAYQRPGSGAKVRINRHGYRSPERPRAKAPGVRRVLVSGGSTTFDLLAPEDRDAWPARLERDLGERGVPAEVWNAGLPTWTSLENVISLAVRDLALAPDVAVLFQGINDLQPASLDPFDEHYERHATLTRRALAFDLAPVPWHRRLVLVERLRRAAGLERPPRSGPRVAGGRVAAPPPEKRRATRLPDAAVATFAQHVRSYVALARSGGARVLLVTQDVRLRAGSEAADARYLEQWIPGLAVGAAAPALEQLNEALRAVAAEEGAALADAAREVAWDDGDFVDPIHHTEAGSAKLARYLAPRVSALLAGVE